MSFKEAIEDRIMFELDKYKGEQTSLCLKESIKYTVGSVIWNFIQDYNLMFDERFLNTQITFYGGDVHVQLSDEFIDYLETL